MELDCGGDPDAAGFALERSRRHELGEDELKCAMALSTLAQFCHDRGDLKRALRVKAQALEAYRVALMKNFCSACDPTPQEMDWLQQELIAVEEVLALPPRLDG